jgi:multidrug efflux pump subunit AcrA (membrane-fusion protein)
VGDLYPEDLPRVKKDQEIIIDGLAGTPPIFGKVSFISPVVDPTVRSIKVRALMENPNLSLRADMYLQGSLVINKTRALIIPSSSILHFQDKNFVFKKVESMDDRGAAGSMQVEKVVVEAGEEAHGKTPIRSGIHAGDFVVSDGALLLDAALNNSSEPK